ncbi:hypothetical protein O5629_28120, partial [Escherichia coli]|nr:hypothetical protein [Escherichia coli]
EIDTTQHHVHIFAIKQTLKQYSLLGGDLATQYLIVARLQSGCRRQAKSSPDDHVVQGVPTEPAVDLFKLL